MPPADNPGVGARTETRTFGAGIRVGGHFRRQDPVSCILCRRKKLRCNRQNPCSNCVVRHITCEREVQLLTTSPQVDQSQSPDEALSRSSNDAVMERLQRLEELVARMNEPPGGRSVENAQENSTKDPTQQSKLQPISVARSEQESRPVSNPAEIAHQTDARQLEEVGNTTYPVIQGYTDEVRFSILPITDMLDARILFPPSTDALSLWRMYTLPPKSEALHLYDLFVRYIAYIYHVIHVPTTRAMIDNIYASLEAGQLDSSVSYGQLAFLLSILASAMSFQATAKLNNYMLLPEATWRALTKRFAKATIDMLDHSRRAEGGTIEHLQGVITTFFLMYSLEGLSAVARVGLGSALHMAKDLGLHRTDYGPCTRFYNMSEVDKEVRRRVWWHLVASDWSVGLTGGALDGTYTIKPAHIACNRPRNINDSELDTSPSALSHPLSIPTDASYLIQRIRLGDICRQVIDAMPLNPDNPDAIPYSQLLELDQKFQALFDELPYFFKLDADSTQLTRDSRATDPYITMQKYTINITANTRRCKIHQPYLVRGFTNPMYRHSRDVCLASARTIIKMHQAIAADENIASGIFNLCGISHHVFFAAVALVMDLCFNKTGDGGGAGGLSDEERRKEVRDACRILKTARDKFVSPIADRLLEGLVGVLRKYGVRIEGLEGGDEMEVSVNEARRPATAKDTGDGIFNTVQGWNGNAMPAFDDLWQEYVDQGLNFEGTDWEKLFNELEP